MIRRCVARIAAHLDGCVARGFPQSFFKTCDANGNVNEPAAKILTPEAVEREQLPY
jgi:hypothetical protein